MIKTAPELSHGREDSHVLAVHSLDHFALAVPDLGVAETFYTSFGLRVETAAHGLQISAARGTTALLREAARRQFEYISFNIDADDLKAFQQRLEAGGIALVDSPRFISAEGLWFRDPDGVLVQVAARKRRAPNSKGTMDVRIAPEACVVRRPRSARQPFRAVSATSCGSHRTYRERSTFMNDSWGCAFRIARATLLLSCIPPMAAITTSWHS